MRTKNPSKRFGTQQFRKKYFKLVLILFFMIHYFDVRVCVAAAAMILEKFQAYICDILRHIGSPHCLSGACKIILYHLIVDIEPLKIIFDYQAYK